MANLSDSFVELLKEVVLREVVLGADGELLQVAEDILQGSLTAGVRNFVFYGRIVGQPMNEQQLVDVHSIFVLVLEVEDAEARLLIGEVTDEVGPLLPLLSDVTDPLGWWNGVRTTRSYRSS